MAVSDSASKTISLTLARAVSPARKFRPKSDATNFPKAWENDLKGSDFMRGVVERWRLQLR